MHPFSISSRKRGGCMNRSTHPHSQEAGPMLALPTRFCDGLCRGYCHSSLGLELGSFRRAWGGIMQYPRCAAKWVGVKGHRRRWKSIQAATAMNLQSRPPLCIRLTGNLVCQKHTPVDIGHPTPRTAFTDDRVKVGSKRCHMAELLSANHGNLRR